MTTIPRSLLSHSAPSPLLSCAKGVQILQSASLSMELLWLPQGCYSNTETDPGQ